MNEFHEIISIRAYIDEIASWTTNLLRSYNLESFERADMNLVFNELNNLAQKTAPWDRLIMATREHPILLKIDL